jgi:hypothetical protein
MNSLYFAIGCILMVAVIYWGSAETEPKKLADFFGPRPKDKPAEADTARKKKRWQ